MDLYKWIELIILTVLVIALYPTWRKKVAESPDKKASQMWFTYVYWFFVGLVALRTVASILLAAMTGMVF
ncbi:hypothetical protein AUQ39_04815 [Lacticaseibacillus casei]|uniref:Uncharacterized protein n=2 Tax=Lacticaseibacillus zeae TaxID=57037 RepID=A0A5R8M1L9_LACZE|nr:hypothetical protein [Lacticaseibacillus casei]OLS09953.1 hypothetical protein AUQ39_04815 [Lacticaseibacillus casei]QVI33495.1 hypothetical protein KG087_10845 [Lacticaseibacillus zeae]TLF42179.1 hypothetical protein FEI14_07790 [Lacticaseibacillus zeae]